MAKEVVLYDHGYSVDTRTSTYGMINHSFKLYLTNYSLINNTADLYLEMRSNWHGSATSFRTDHRGLLIDVTFYDSDGYAANFPPNMNFSPNKTFYEDTPVAGQPGNVHNCTWTAKIGTIDFNKNLDIWTQKKPKLDLSVYCYNYFGYDQVYVCQLCGHAFLKHDYISAADCPSCGAHANVTNLLAPVTPSMTGNGKYVYTAEIKADKFLPADVIPASSVYVYTENAFNPYLTYIFDKATSTWKLYRPYIYDGTKWCLY